MRAIKQNKNFLLGCSYVLREKYEELHVLKSRKTCTLLWTYHRPCFIQGVTRVHSVKRENPFLLTFGGGYGDCTLPLIKSCTLIGRAPYYEIITFSLN